MNHLIPYDPNKTFMYPNGSVADPERIRRDFPAVSAFPHVIETDDSETMCYAVMALGALKTNHKLDKNLRDTDAVEAINAIMRTPPPEPEPSAEERIAAAMEYQNLLTLDDVEDVEYQTSDVEAAAKSSALRAIQTGSMDKVQARHANFVARGIWTSRMLDKASVRKGVMPRAMADAVIAEVEGGVGVD